MTLTEFINKARDKEANKIKAIVLKVEDFGEVDFTRPNREELINYTQVIMDMVNETGLEENQNNFDYGELAKQSSKFVYNCCPLIREKEIRDMYRENEFEEIPEIIFGTNEVIRLAGELFNIFSGTKALEKRVNDIKN